MSLARAFLYAGARTVVATLWDVGDADSLDLMDGFYRRIVDGAAIAPALTGAQRELIALGAPPRAWAAYVVTGRPGTHARVSPRQAPARWPTALALTAGLGIFWGVRFRWPPG